MKEKNVFILIVLLGFCFFDFGCCQCYLISNCTKCLQHSICGWCSGKINYWCIATIATQFFSGPDYCLNQFVEYGNLSAANFCEAGTINGGTPAPNSTASIFIGAPSNISQNITCPLPVQHAYLNSDCASCLQTGHTWVELGGIGVCSSFGNLQTFASFHGANIINSQIDCRKSK